MAQWLVFHLFFLLLLLSFILPLLSHFTSLILLFLSPCFPALPSLAFHPFRAAPPSSLSQSFQAFSSFQYVFLSFSPPPPLLLTPSSFQTSHSQASRPASHFLLPLPFPFVFLHWDLLSYLKLSAGSGDFLQPRPWKRRPSAGSSPSTLGINKRCSVVEVLKMLTCCGCSLTAWVLMLVRRHVLGVQTLLQV